MTARRMVAALGLLLAFGATAQDVGDWVLARWKGDRYWFPGIVVKRFGDNVTIDYDDGTRETLPSRLVRPYDWRVGTQVQCQWQGGSDWYAGKITAVSSDGTRIGVAYDDGDREQTNTGACREE